MAFNMFPFTNLHNLNTDWILKTIKELKAAAETAASQVQEALQNAVLYTSQSKDTSSRRVACTNIHAVNYDSTPLGSADAAQARYNIGAAAAADVVRISEQELTEEQKTQARNNIEAADQTTVGSLVRQMTQQVVKVTEQSWTDDQKAQARTNIGAASNAALGELDSEVGLKVDDTNGSATNLTVEGLNISDGEDIVTIPISAVGTTNAPILDISDGQHYTKISGVGDPISNQHAANKHYVDSRIGALPAATSSDEGKVPTVQSDGTYALDAMSTGIHTIQDLLNLTDVMTVQQQALFADNTDLSMNPTVYTSQSTDPLLEPADNCIYEYGELTTLEVIIAPINIAYIIKFDSGSTPTETVFPVEILGLETFVPEADTSYEINIWDRKALVASWPIETTP